MKRERPDRLRASPPRLLLALPLALPRPVRQSWMVRLRAIDFAPNASSSISGLDVEDSLGTGARLHLFLHKNVAAS